MSSGNALNVLSVANESKRTFVPDRCAPITMINSCGLVGTFITQDCYQTRMRMLSFNRLGSREQRGPGSIWLLIQVAF
jgi:hypothetical protein